MTSNNHSPNLPSIAGGDGGGSLIYENTRYMAAILWPAFLSVS